MRNYWAERKPGHVPCLALSLSRSGGVTIPIHLVDDSGGCRLSGTRALCTRGTWIRGMLPETLSWASARRMVTSREGLPKLRGVALPVESAPRPSGLGHEARGTAVTHHGGSACWHSEARGLPSSHLQGWGVSALQREERKQKADHMVSLPPSSKWAKSKERYSQTESQWWGALLQV